MKIKRKRKVKDHSQTNLLDQIDQAGLTEEQGKYSFYDQNKSIILMATAGSGKTHSSVHRLKYLLQKGVDPKRIIFFSFTKAAVDELKKRVGNPDVRITTIHAFCLSVLLRAGRKKEITNFYSFIDWYKNSYKPGPGSSIEDRMRFQEIISEMFENSELISSQISSFKLQMADNIKTKMPDYFLEYERFQKSNGARDFSDMLIEVDELFKQDKWLNLFKDKYDYIIIDEFQDTSTIQLRILLKLNAKNYYMIGDTFQSIYGFGGTNHKKLISMLSENREVETMSLTKNFRSDIAIIDNSNNYSDLKAHPKSIEVGNVDYDVIFTIRDLQNILDENDEVAVLVRTNKIIKQMELAFLHKKYPMRYFNYITETDISNFKSGNVHHMLKRKMHDLVKIYGSEESIIQFIEMNRDSKKFITSIHKSKGREFDTCVVVNSIAPEILKANSIVLPKKEFKKVSFEYDDEDREEQNIHYVAVSRPKHKLYFMLYGNP